MEEARRLCYVAITRAKEKLYITSAEVRRVFGRTVSYSQSQFISEIDLKLREYINERSMENNTSNGSFRKPSAYNNPHSLRNQRSAAGYLYTEKLSSNVNSSSNLDDSEVLTSDKVTMGMKVKHDKFGIGTVVSVVPAGKDKKLTIAFDRQGVKTLMLSFAKLKMV